MASGVMINIRHGGYTPVQTRTRINMPEDQKSAWEWTIRYSVVAKGMYMFYFQRMGGIYSNSDSTATATQLKFDIYNLSYADLKDNVYHNQFPNYYIGTFVLHTDLNPDINAKSGPLYPLLPDSLANYTNRLIDYVGEDPPEQNKARIEKKIKEIVHTVSPEDG